MNNDQRLLGSLLQTIELMQTIIELQKRIHVLEQENSGLQSTLKETPRTVHPPHPIQEF